MIQAEKDVVEHMLESLTISSLQTGVAPSNEQVTYHFELACERVGLIVTLASTIRIFKRLAREIHKAQSVLEFIGRGADQIQ
ncbi:hypothetical protein [Bradyrhizobium neotropicale]|uniref:hypothetical protein n=1 Tax=Bradyrhizobium neotropicale TaxID=1497615 RepID=UPI001FEFDFFC|nr:hypothetical protein [Bradyrhizobium neotropicale]